MHSHPAQTRPADHSPVRSSSKRWLAVLILLGFMAWLAIHFPHNSLWYDEALTTYVATDSWATLWHWCTQVDIQVPFHYVVLRMWTWFAGDSEFALRLLSALCALLAVAGMIAMGRRVARKSGAGLAAAILLGTMPGMLWIAYEVRAYALALALVVWATVFLWAIIDRVHLTPNPSPWHGEGSRNRPVPPRYAVERGAGGEAKLLIAYALLMLAALYTHYTALGAFAAHLVILLIVTLTRHSRTVLTSLIAIVILVGVGFAPWLPIMLTRSAADRSYYTGAPIPPIRSTAVMLGFKLLARDDAPDVALPLIIGYAALIVLGVIIGWRHKRAVLTGLLLTIFPMAITAALVYFKPKLAGRYAWPAWIGFDLLAALVITWIARRWRGISIAALAVVIAVPWLTEMRGHPPDSDFRGAFAYICAHGDPNDVIALRDGTLFVVARYYGQRAPCTTPRYTVDMPAALMTNVEQALTLPLAQAAVSDMARRKPPNVWIVAWQGDIMDPQGLAYGLLDGTGQHSVVGKMFGDVRLDHYENPSPVTGDPLALAKPVNVTPIPNGPVLQAMRLIAPDVAHTGDTLVLQTWWRRGSTLQPDLRVSAKITTLDGGWTYAQVDQPPAGWKYVDDRWLIDVPALGRYELPIGGDVLPGKVAVRYVIYDANKRWEPITLTVGEVTIR
ncbi:MAG: glycosyltransferase family 39 protein [Anaerolineae bacterium]|nr:glycosyltransferase family 39 protein [Anaerolineae bacterium]